MKTLFLYLFIALLFPLLSLSADSNNEPRIEIITTPLSFKPSQTNFSKEPVQDFLTIRVTGATRKSSFMNVVLSTHDTDEIKRLCFDHVKGGRHMHFYLLDKRGNKVMNTNTRIRLQRNDDGSFESRFDLVIEPVLGQKTISGDYLCTFKVKLNEEHAK